MVIFVLVKPLYAPRYVRGTVRTAHKHEKKTTLVKGNICSAFSKYSIISTKVNTITIQIGRIKAEELAASFQSLAPKYLIIVAVTNPLQKPPNVRVKKALRKLKYLR